MARFIFTFETNDPKVIINLNEFSFLSKPMVWQPRIQISNSKLCFYWNENFVFTLMNMLKDNFISPLDCVISLFNTSCNANVTKKQI